MLGTLRRFIQRVMLALLSWVLLFFIFMGFLAWSTKKHEPKLESGSFLTINLDSPVVESPMPKDPVYQLALNMGATKPPIQLRAALDAIEAAASEAHINGILLKASCVNHAMSNMGTGQAKALRDALLEFKETSGKPIHAYLDGAALGHYYVASVADSVTFMPHATLSFTGLGGHKLFWGGFFEKYGIGAQGVSSGAYKTAVEIYTRTGFTPESRSQRQAVVDSIWESLKADIADSRNLKPEHLQEVSDHVGKFYSEQAFKEGLIDHLDHWDSFLERVNSLGTLNEKTQAVRQISLSDYIYLNEKQLQPSQEGRIAIVYAEGPMHYQKPKRAEQHIHGATLAARLRKLRKNEKVKAVVLRIDTPGGAADAAEQIHREVSLLRETKPVVVSMSTVAASGGYYISAPADAIIAESVTTTGSIGVVSVAFNAQRLANDHELYWDKVVTGPYAGIYSLAEPNTEAFLAQRQKQSDMLYEHFKSLVAQGRKLDFDRIEALAGGRVWSGTQALENGLVDARGGLKTAIQKARELAGLTQGSVSIREYGSSSTQLTLLDLFMGSTSLSQHLLPAGLNEALKALDTQDKTLEILERPAYLLP